MNKEEKITRHDVANYVKYLVASAQVEPTSFFDKSATILHTIFGFIFAILIPLQLLSTFILGILVTITFGLLLLPLSIVFWWPFFGILLASSWLWQKLVISRPIILIPGVFIAAAANALVAFMPSMGEWESRGFKLAFCESWPHSLSLYNQYKNKLH